MPLDVRILEIATEAMRPMEITRVLAEEGTHPGINTQRVASRLKSLVDRGMMTRIRPAGGPANGPGTSLYRVKTEGDSSSDG
jgi:hypothetical protein